MKHSPLCTRDGGREVYFTVAHDSGKYRLVVPWEFLDDNCGDSASEATRREWVKGNLPDILGVLTAHTGGGTVKAPWTRIVVEEIG